MKTLKETCNHGKKIWGNYGDGKVRHIAADGKPTMQLCDNYETEKSYERETE